MLEYGGVDVSVQYARTWLWTFRFKSSSMLEHDCGCFGSNPPPCLSMAVRVSVSSSMLEHGCGCFEIMDTVIISINDAPGKLDACWFTGFIRAARKAEGLKE